MKQNESAAGVTGIELFDPFDGQPQESVIFRHLRLFGIGVVRKQGEAEVGSRVGEASDLQLVDLIADRVRGQQHHRDNDERPAVVRYSVLKRHLRQHPGRHFPCHPGLYEEGGELAGRNQSQNSESGEHRG